MGNVLDQVPGRRVLVVGDMMRDVDIHGRCDRFAAEASGCPVFTEERREERPGGAGAVAAMVAALGATVDLVTGPPSLKVRHFAGGRQVWRHDTDAGALTRAQLSEILAHLRAGLDDADVVLIADHGKGACTPGVLRTVIEGAADRGIQCLVDPAPGSTWEEYRAATLIKCNRAEWDGAYDRHKRESAGWWERLVYGVIVTDGPQGMTHYPRRAGAVDYPTRARPAVDVTGCGDLVLAVLGVCMASGAIWDEACDLANRAAGIKVGRHGATPVTRAELAAELAGGGKVLDRAGLADRLAGERARGRRVVMTGGCFDLLHAGHTRMLAEARQIGDVLAVAVNDDAGVTRLKGLGRPVNHLADRLAVLAGLACVDYVCAFAENTPAELLDVCRPDVWVKGGGYAGDELPEAATVERHGGIVRILGTTPGRSTSALVERIRATAPAFATPSLRASTS
ncbi:MAG: hldE [Gemmataceae bacterium]|nr:hldE [Gemmataceae bacterium]